MIFVSEAFVVPPFCLRFAQTARMILSKRFNQCCGPDTGTNMFCTEQFGGFVLSPPTGARWQPRASDHPRRLASITFIIVPR